MTLTKEHLVEAVYNNVGYSKANSRKLIDSLIEIIMKTLENGEDVLISGFGKFCMKEKNKRRGRNPQTGDDMILGAKRIVTFRCSGKLKAKLNKRK